MRITTNEYRRRWYAMNPMRHATPLGYWGMRRYDMVHTHESVKWMLRSSWGCLKIWWSVRVRTFYGDEAIRRMLNQSNES